MRGSVFRIKEALNALNFVFDKPMISTPSRNMSEVVVQPLLVGAFVVRITKHKIIRVLQQSASTGSDGVSLQGKYKRGKNTHIIVQVRRAPPS